MIIRRYADQDFETICKWLDDWNLPHPKRSMLPKIGFFVEGIAVGFLEQPDTDSCYFENLYTNKTASKDDREKAINKIFDSAIETARMMGFNRILSVTDHPAMIKRAVQRKAKLEINKVLIIKNLGE